METNDQRLRDVQRQYVEYLEDDSEATVKDLLSSETEVRLIVDVNDLRKRFPVRAKTLLEDAFDEILGFQRALKEFALALDPSKAKEKKELFVGFEGSFGPRHLTPRTLHSRHLNNLVCIEGIITKVSLVRPKIVNSVHYCPATAKSMERSYSDMTSLESFPSSAAYPTQDEDGNPLQTEYGLSYYKDHQTLTVQELPEKAPTGQLPRSVDVICEHDLVDKVKPGDRVQIVGAYRCLPGKQGGFTSGTFKTILLANNIQLQSQESEASINADDVLKCKKVCKQRKDIFELLAQSLAPSIHGHDHVKRALLCMLLGGVEKILPNGSRIRGDINVLLIGDPSVAKSQMLRYVLSTAPRAITTTGRGSSGVGLTAAVTTDSETGERRLEAGAMVLGDRGIVCIDEFDKMTDIDRTAIHEVMEQGRVTISKAGIQARLNARCSVLAAANPVYGRYDPFKPPMENIGLQDSLLSRFDLLFVLLDTVDVDSDRKIADHVVKVHRYRNANEEDGSVAVIDSEANDLTTKQERENKELVVWDKQSYLNTAGKRNKNERLTSSFIKKYVEIAKCIKPVLTEEACEIIGEEYSRLRSQDWDTTGDVARTQPVTARALETLIRLSCAHAKARLSKTVNKDDAEAAIELVQFAYFKKVLEKDRRKRRHSSSSDSELETSQNMEEEEEKEKMEEEEEGEKEKEKRKSVSIPKRSRKEDTPPSQPVDVSKSIGAFKKALMNMFAEKHAQSLELSDIKKTIMEKTNMNENEIMACIDNMSDDNKIMLSSGTVYLI